ncbi:MAG TPA: ATP-binding protein [Gaiellaceae bacterium]
MSLRLRLLGAFAYVLLLILIALEVPLGLSLARRIEAEVKNGASAQAFIVAAGAAGRMSNRTELRRLVKDSGDELGARVIVVNRQGRLLADSTTAPPPSVSYASRPEIRTVIDERRAVQGIRHSDTLGKDLLYTAVPVTNNGRVLGAVRVTQSMGAVHARVRRAVLALIGIGAFALLVGLAVAWFLANSLSKPMRNVAETARRVEGGDLEARAKESGAAEQREVATALNDMTERLGRILGAQREFVANASHQLRTPLTGLRLRLEAARAKSPEGARGELEAAEREVERLARVLTSLLTLAREGDEPGPARAVSLARAAELAQERWSASAGERTLHLLGNGDATIAASEEDVAIVLDNLIENALHYSEGAVSVDWGAEDGEAWLAVIDEGPGLAPGEEARLFERFARGTAAGKRSGTGLGLAIVQTLAHRWRGEARVANRAEGGMRAEVRFPSATTVERWPEHSS